MQRLELSFLGPPRIEVDGRLLRADTRKAIALLAYLAVTGGSQSRDSLVTLLWSRYGRAGGYAALRRTLSAVRTGLSPDLLQTEKDSIAINPSSKVHVDVQSVKELLAQCDSHSHAGIEVCAACLPLLSEAARLHRGEFLAGFTLKDSLAFDDWQFFMTEDFRLQRSRILGKLSLCHAAIGDYDSAIGVTRMRLSQDPLDENAHATLIRLYAWAGNRSAALRQYDECTRILMQELNSPPRKSTEHLHEAIAHGRLPRPPRFDAPPVSVPASAPCRPPVGDAHRPFAISPKEEGLSKPAEAFVATVLVTRAAESRGAARRSTAAGADHAAAVLRATARSIARYRGLVVEEQEGGLTALFSDRGVLESNPELAIRAALDIEAIAEHSGVASVGVATGQVWHEPGDPASHQEQHTAGKPVSVALKLVGQSRPGSVVVDEHTYRLTRNAFSFEPTVAWRAATARAPRAYRVLGIAQDAKKTRGLEGTRAMLVGREEEVRRLQAAYEKTTGGRGQVLIITGDAGIGKSRLVEELRAHVAERAPNTRPLWLEGRCLAPSMAVGYWPFVDMLSALGAGRPAAPGVNDVTLGGLMEELAQKGFLSPAQVRQLTPVMTGLVTATASDSPADPGLAPEQRKQMTFAAAQTFFRALASDAPLVLVFEDLHWADDLSMELIDALLDSLKDTSTLFICIYRPDPGHKSRHLSSIAARRRQVDLTEIHLREITMEHGERLLESLDPRGTIPEATRGLILQRSQGNPYFLEELARAASGGETPLEDEGEASGDPLAVSSGMSIPEGIKRVILSRYYGLPSLQRQVLGYGAVIGRIFRKRLLELAVDGGDLAPVLEDLEDRELLFIERTVPDVEYSFKHVLAQQAIYDNLAEPERRELHRRVAHAYEQLSSENVEEYCEQLAFHCDRGNLAAKAVDFYYRSGEKARRAYANEAAISHLSRGLTLLRGAGETGNALSRELDFLLAIGVPLVLTKGHPSPEVETVYLRAKAICEQTGNGQQLFQSILGLRRLYFARGEHHRERELVQQMLELGRQEQDVVLTARAHMMFAETLLALGDFPAALDHARKGCEHCQPAEHLRHLVQFGNDTGVGCIVYTALAQWLLGFPDQALRTVECALARARERAHPFTLVFALHNAAVVAYFRREPQGVLRWATEVTSVSRQEGFVLYRSWGPILHGWALGMMGEEERGIAMIREGLESSPPFLPFRTLFASMLAEVFLKRGRTLDAISALEEGLTMARSTDAHLWEPELNRLRGEIGLLAGEMDIDAVRWISRAVRAARKQHAKCLELRATMSLCRLQAKGEHPEPALDRLDALVRSFAEGRETRDLEDARLLLEKLRS